MSENEKPPEAMKFTSIDDLRDYLIEIKPYFSYEKIATAYGVNKGIVWKILNTDYEPYTYEIRVAFGLPVRVMVQTVNGYIEPGSISLGSKRCPNKKCNQQSYIPNAGKREQCFTCQPPRDRKAEILKQKEARND